MSDLKVCRICLRAQCKVYKYDRFQLRAYYEEVMAQKMNEKDGLPNYFCYECATVLHKFHKFKEKCWMGQRMLRQIQTSEKNITYEAIHQIDRTRFNLNSPLEIIRVTKRVKTYVTVEKADNSETECERTDVEDEKEINIEDIEDAQVFLDEGSTFEDHYDSDTPIKNFKKHSISIENQKPVNLVNNDVEDVVYDNELDQKFEIEEDINISSPITVFVDVKKDMIVLKSEPIKERKKSCSEHKKISPKFTISKNITKPNLGKYNWKISTLTEEEAVKEFQLRAENQSYKDAAFKCVDCFKGFSKEDMLKRHRQLRHSETLGQLECRFCHKRFKWDSKLRRHMVEHFTRYKCLLCGIEVCVEYTALLHDDWHKGALKKCHHCGEEFRHRSSYYTHLRTHRSAHVCALCGMSFVSPSGLHMHRKIKHVDDCIIDEDEDDEPANTFCEKCDIRFENRQAFEKHIFHSVMHADEANDGRDTSRKHKKILGKRIQDKMLGKRPAKIVGNLARGSKRSSTDDEEMPLKRSRRPRYRRRRTKPTTCHQCGKHFDTQAACMKHHQTEHPRTSFFSVRHICEICGASLAPGSVAMHQNIHSRENEFPCDTCGRKFHSYAGLKRHLVTHTGEKPFACSLCDKRFTQSNSMKLHYNTFHLKQPYPKRNRRKKKDELLELPANEEKSSSESEASQPAPSAGVEPATTHTHTHTNENNDTMHYLTLS